MKKYIILLLVLGLAVSAAAKSLYFAADHHSRQFDAWTINPDGTVVKQATYGLQHSTDPAGIAIDEDSGVMFVTSEFSGGVEMVDPVTLTYIGVSSGPSNLGGIDVDDVDDIVYTVQRYTNQLYIFLWDEAAKTLTQDAVVTLPNCSGAFGLALDEFTDTLWVADSASGLVRAYDVGVTSWSNIAEIAALSFQASHVPIDVAVDRLKGFVYTVSVSMGAWTPPGAGSNILSKYDLGTSIETTTNLGCQGVGVTVDEVTGYVYVTVSPYCADWPYQGQIHAWDPSTTPWTQVDADTVAGSPAGIVTANISYNPLKLAKNDVIVGEVYIGSTFTYELSYENPNLYDVRNVTIVDTLPPELDFMSATNGGVYDADTHTVTWNIGTVPAGTGTTTIDLVVKVNQNAVPGSTIYNYATIEADEVPPTTVIDDEGSDDPGDEPGTPIGENIPVAFDIKPGSCPNPLNPKSRGVLPATILGTADFDVYTIDPASIRLTLNGNGDGEVPPLRWAYDDVATPFEGKLCECHDYNGDGYLDLTLKFKTQEIVHTLDLNSYSGETLPLTLAGNLMEDYGRIPIYGQDCVWILEK